MPINTSGFAFSDNAPVNSGGGYQPVRPGALSRINPASFALDLVTPFVTGIKGAQTLLAPLAEGVVKIADYYRPENVEQRDLDSKERALKGLQTESDQRLLPTMEEFKRVNAEVGAKEAPLRLQNLKLDIQEKTAANAEIENLRKSGMREVEIQTKAQEVKNQADIVKLKQQELEQAAKLKPDELANKQKELDLETKKLDQQQKEFDQTVEEGKRLNLNLSTEPNEVDVMSDARRAAALARTHKGTTPDFWLKNIAASRGGGDGLSEDQKKVGNALFKDFQDHATVKSYSVASSAMNSLSELANPKLTPTAQNDMAIIFSYMKILDPNSTVREGEYATAQNAGSVPENIRKKFNKALDGTLLSPKDRANFIQSAKRAFTGQKKNYDRVRKLYSDQAEANKLPKEFVVGNEEPAPTDESGQPIHSEGEVLIRNGVKYKFDAKSGKFRQ